MALELAPQARVPRHKMAANAGLPHASMIVRCTRSTTSQDCGQRERTDVFLAPRLSDLFWDSALLSPGCV